MKKVSTLGPGYGLTSKSDRLNDEKKKREKVIWNWCMESSYYVEAVDASIRLQLPHSGSIPHDGS